MANKRWTDDKLEFINDFVILKDLCGWDKEKYFFPFDCTDFEDISIKEMDLSIRSENALMRSKIYTIADIVKKWDIIDDPKMVLKNNKRPIRNLGINSAHEVRCKFYNFCYSRLSWSEKWQFWKKFERLNYRKGGRI